MVAMSINGIMVARYDRSFCIDKGINHKYEVMPLSYLPVRLSIVNELLIIIIKEIRETVNLGWQFPDIWFLSLACICVVTCLRRCKHTSSFFGYSSIACCRSGAL